MWLSFVLVCALCVGVLYVPGFLVLISLRSLRWSDALACAPLVSVAFYAAVAIALPGLGPRASLATLVLPLAVAGALALAMGLVFRRLVPSRGHAARESVGEVGFEIRLLALTLAMGVLVTGFYFVRNLDGPASVFQAFDNGTHLNTIASFLETGNYSSFYYDAYPEPGAVPPLTPSSSSSFYPSAWHGLVALSMAPFEVSIPLGINAVNTVLLGIVYPLSMYALLRRIFEGNRRLRVIGAILAVALPSGVLDFVSFGPLYPMLLAYALAPMAIACFISLTSLEGDAGGRLCYGVLFVLGCVAIGLAQPSGIFLMAVILAPYLVRRAGDLLERRKGSSARTVRGGMTIAALLIAGFWYLCYRLPFFESVVSFTWEAKDSLPQALLDVLLLSTRGHTANFLMGALVLLGLYVAVKRERFRWLVGPYAIAALSYVMSVTTETELKHILGGFWYTDPHRLGANLAIAAIPLAVLGASALFDLIRAFACWLSSRSLECPSPRSVTSVVSVVLCALVFLPTVEVRGLFTVNTPLGAYGNRVETENDLDAPHVLDAEEIEFAQRAFELIPEGALVINSPNDGSGFLYALYGYNTYYRMFALNQLDKTETEQSELVRTSLDSIASRADVREAAEEIGAWYVLLLDQGDNYHAYDESESESMEAATERREYFWSYYPGTWDGVDVVTDDTPGFEILLAEDDMRLYRIVL